MTTRYSGAYSRRRYSNLATPGIGKNASHQETPTGAFFTLTYGSSDTSMGDVEVLQTTSTVAGSNSGDTPMNRGGSATFAAGTQVRVVANPKTGCHFVRWEGDFPAGKGTTNPVTLTMTKNAGIRAIFARNAQTSFNVTVSCDETMGRVNPRGENSVPAGSQLTLEATANPGYHFVRWAGIPNATSRTESTVTITVNSNYTIAAVFEKDGNGGNGGGNGGNGGGNGGNGGGNGGNGGETPATPGLVDQALAFCKKYWWALAIAVLIIYDTKKGGKK